MGVFVLLSAIPSPLDKIDAEASEPEKVAEVVEEKIEEESSDAEEKEEPKQKEKVLTWRDNPNDCDQSKQYIAAEEPFRCIDKPAPTRNTNASQASSPSVSRNSTNNCEQYRHLVSQYSWDTDTMMRAMRLESSCNPNAVGDQYVIGGVYAPSCGLLQVRTLPGRPSCEQLKDPAFNIATAYKIWQGQGYRAWTVLH